MTLILRTRSSYKHTETWPTTGTIRYECLDSLAPADPTRPSSVEALIETLPSPATPNCPHPSAHGTSRHPDTQTPSVDPLPFTYADPMCSPERHRMPCTYRTLIIFDTPLGCRLSYVHCPCEARDSYCAVYHRRGLHSRADLRIGLDRHARLCALRHLFVMHRPDL